MDEKRRQELTKRREEAELALSKIEEAMSLAIQAKVLRKDHVAYDDQFMQRADQAYGSLRRMQEETVVYLYDMKRDLSRDEK